MASPQVENGWVSIANEIVEALAKTHLSGYESRVIWYILRQTYGWHKKEDWITNTLISEKTGIAESHVSRTKKILIQRKIITKNGKKLAFQKDYDKWQKLPKMVSSKKLPFQEKKLPKMVSEITNIGKKKLPKMVDTKETKETYTKETIQKTKVPNLDLTPFLPTSLQFLCKQKEDDLYHPDFKNELSIKSRIVISGAEILEKLNRIEKESIDDIKKVLSFILEDTGDENWIGWKINVVSLSSLRRKKDGEMKYFKIKNLMAHKYVKTYTYEEMIRWVTKEGLNQDDFERLENGKYVRKK